MVTAMHDTFGRALLDALDGRPGTHTIERDDGYRHDMDAAEYLTGREAWPQALGDALDELYGRRARCRMRRRPTRAPSPAARL